MENNLINCPCGFSDACLENKFENFTTKFCFSCGFETNSNWVEDSDIVKQSLESTAEIVKDICFVDESNQVWFPRVMKTNTHMVFVDGTSENDWRWAVVDLVEGEVKTKTKTKKELKPNMDTLKHFDPKNFIDVLDYIGYFTKS